MLAFLLRLILYALAFVCTYQIARLAFVRLSFISQSKRNLNIEDILRDQALCFLMFFAFGAVLSYAISIWLIIPSAVIAFILSKRMPSMLDARRKKELRSACDEQIDMMADIVAMGVQSGLSFDAALDLYCSKFDNTLSQHLHNSRLEWGSGLASRKDAMNALSTRIDSKALRRFSETSIQAIHHGSPLADMLKRFSSDVRQRRRNAIERQIAKAPVKLLIPTGTCILPAMLILVMGPVLLQFTQTSF